MKLIDNESRFFDNELSKLIALNNRRLENEKDKNKILEIEIYIEVLFELRKNIIPYEKKGNKINWDDKDERKAYRRRYNQKNKEKSRSYYLARKERIKKHHENNKEKVIKRTKDYYKNNPDKKREHALKYYHKNKEAINKKLRESRKNEQ